MFYRMEYDEDDKNLSRALNRQITDLQVTAMKRNICIIIVGQVYTNENDEIKPFAGRGIEHMAKTIIRLEKTDTCNKRQAVIIKHRSQPECSKAFFTITNTGLE